MKLSLNDKIKIDKLIAIFQLLKNCSSVVKLEFYKEKFIIQGMDKSHVCLFVLEIKSKWLTDYSNNEDIQIMVDTASLFMIFFRIQENQILILEYNKDKDSLDIDVLCNDSIKKGEYNRYFQLPLIDLEQDSYSIPDLEYDADFTINAKQFNELISQLILFGDILNIICNEKEINLESNSENGKMKVEIPIDDLREFSIAEGENMELSFSINYIHKMCLTTKLSKDIEISISKDFPIRIKYDLGEESFILFFIAPKI